MLVRYTRLTTGRHLSLSERLALSVSPRLSPGAVVGPDYSRFDPKAADGSVSGLSKRYGWTSTRAVGSRWGTHALKGLACSLKLLARRLCLLADAPKLLGGGPREVHAHACKRDAKRCDSQGEHGDGNLPAEKSPEHQ